MGTSLSNTLNMSQIPENQRFDSEVLDGKVVYITNQTKDKLLDEINHKKINVRILKEDDYLNGFKDLVEMEDGSSPLKVDLIDDVD